MTQEQLLTMPVRALAFDVDGTIADTDPIHAEAWARALESVNCRRFDLSDYLEACINGAMTPQQFLAGYCEPGDWIGIETEKRRIYPGLLAQRASLTPGLVELLAEARSAAVAIAIVSSSSRESVRALLNGPWTAAPPNIIVARADSPSAKPSPEPYRTAVRLLNIPEKFIVVFEDSASGISSAESAGLTCIQLGLECPALAKYRIKDFRDCSITSSDRQPFLTVRTR